MVIAVGIDLGTTSSRVAVMEHGRPRVITSAEGDDLFPSVVAVSNTGEYLVGQSAKRQAVTNAENTISGIKRFMGLKWGEPPGREPSAKENARRKTYKVNHDQNDEARVLLNGKQYSPTAIASMILRKLKADAEAYLGETVADAVISVPAHFSFAQREATREAATTAGLDVLRMIDEPSAVALDYAFRRKSAETVAIYDFGGGVVDISIVDIEVDEDASLVTVIVSSTIGDSFLGGDDLDQRIVDWISDEFERDEGIGLRQDRTTLLRLAEAAEKAKIELSTVQQVSIDLPVVATGASSYKDLHVTMTRTELERLAMPLVEQSLQLCERALGDAHTTTAQIDKVILAGGQTRMPLVRTKARQFFGKEPTKSVNVDEAVARGAAIQAGVLKGAVVGVLLLDVIPLTLGIETLGGVATPLIPRNTNVPVSNARVFSTARDSQTAVQIHVLQGDKPLAADNVSLGSLVFDGILPQPRGIPQILVSLDVHANGMLQVEVLDRGTGKREQLQEFCLSGRKSIDPSLMPTEPAQEGYPREGIVVAHDEQDTMSDMGSSPQDFLDRRADNNLKDAAAELLREKARTKRAERNRSRWSL